MDTNAVSNATIHVAHSAHSKGGLRTFRAVAVVTNKGWSGYHSKTVAVDDTPDEAESRAVKYVQDIFRRERLPIPTETVSYGRRRATEIEVISFVPHELIRRPSGL